MIPGSFSNTSRFVNKLSTGFILMAFCKRKRLSAAATAFADSNGAKLDSFNRDDGLKTTQKMRDAVMFESLNSRDECLSILKSCDMFNEKEIYGIVLDYLLASCAVSEDIPTLMYHDRVGTIPLDAGLAGVRFCFNECLTFARLGDTFDIGLTTRRAPYQNYFIHARKALYVSLGNFLGLLNGMNGANHKLTDMTTTLSNTEKIYPENRLVFAEVLKKQDKMTVKIGYDSPSKPNQLDTVTVTVTIDRFDDMPLRPFITIRHTTPISVYPLL